MGKSVTFRMVEHDPGGFKIPTKAKNSGQFILDVDKGKNSFHFDGTREKLGGTMAGWTVVTEPVATTDGGTAVRVTTGLRTKPDVAPRRFVLLGVSKAEFDALLEEMRPALVAQEEQVNQVVSAKSSGQWWAGLGKVAMTHVLYGGKDGILKVAPDDGLQWSPGLGKTRIPFGAIAKIEIGETTRQHGRQHGAIGFGGIGLAVVAATAVHQSSGRACRHVQRHRRDHEGRQAAPVRHAEGVVAPGPVLRGLSQSERTGAGSRACSNTTPGGGPVSSGCHNRRGRRGVRELRRRIPLPPAARSDRNAAPSGFGPNHWALGTSLGR